MVDHRTPAILATSMDEVRVPALGSEAVDGRNVRRETNRIAVADAYLDLVHEGNLFPSVAEVSQRSGVSHRSVFRYFTDRDSMAQASIKRQHERVRALAEREIDAALPFDTRAEHIVEKRLDLYGAGWATAQLCRVLSLTQPILLDELTGNRARMRLELKRVFRSELALLPSGESREALALLDVVLSFESMDLLRRDQAFSRVRAARTLQGAIASILSSPANAQPVQ